VRAGPRRRAQEDHRGARRPGPGPGHAGRCCRRGRCELAADFLQDLRRIDDQMQQARKKPAAAVRASGTTLTEVFGVGPVIAAIVIGEAGDITRFAGRDHFAACNGTAPIEVSSGNRKVHRLSRRGNRRLNHAVHMAAVTQVSQRHSEGRAYYDKKIAEGKTAKEALRALKRQVSDTLYKRLKADAARAAASTQDPGGHQGNDSVASAPGSHPEHRLFGQAPPGPAPTLRDRPREREKAMSPAIRKSIRTT
jgi:transposase